MGEAPRGPNPHGGWGALGTHSAPARPSPGPRAGVGSGQGLALYLGAARLAAIPSPVRWAEPLCLRRGGHGLQHRTSPETGPWLSICQGVLLEGDRHTTGRSRSEPGRSRGLGSSVAPRLHCRLLGSGGQARKPVTQIPPRWSQAGSSDTPPATWPPRTLGPCLRLSF